MILAHNHTQSYKCNGFTTLCQRLSARGRYKAKNCLCIIAVLLNAIFISENYILIIEILW